MKSEGQLLHICVSATKGICKHEVPNAVVVVGHGLEGDAHTGAWHRQVSLLACADIESMQAKGLNLQPGAFGENLVIDRVNTDELGVGSTLRLGSVLLEITQLGKVCHTRCAIYYATGDCIMPRVGLFARVLEGGLVAPGLPVEVVSVIPRSTIQAAVITVSDRCSRGATRASGPAIAEILRDELDAHIAWVALIPDEAEQIAAALKDFTDRKVDLIVTTGGTDIGPRDVTPEATQTVLDRAVPGLSELMRAMSAKATPLAALSRAVVGIRRTTMIVNVPGSRTAAIENLRAVLPAIPHAIKLLRNETAHPELDVGRLVALKIEANTPERLTSPVDQEYCSE